LDDLGKKIRDGKKEDIETGGELGDIVVGHLGCPSCSGRVGIGTQKERGTSGHEKKKKTYKKEE